MAYEMKDGQGSLFQNDRKQSEKAPDFKGKLKFGGKMYDVSGWTKLTKGGQEFLSLQVADEWVPGSNGSSPRPAPSRMYDAYNPPETEVEPLDDVIPF